MKKESLIKSIQYYSIILYGNEINVKNLEIRTEEELKSIRQALKIQSLAITYGVNAYVKTK